MTTYNEAGQTYEDLDFLYDGMPAARSLSVLIGTMASAEDVTEDLDWDSFKAVDNGTSGRGLISARIFRTIASLTTLVDQALVRVIDHDLNADTHRGVIIKRRPVRVPGEPALTEISAHDVGGLIDDTFIDLEQRSAETMQARVTALWQSYAPEALDTDDLSFVASIGGTLPAQDFVGVTLRQAIESTIAQASSSADYYIDPLGKLHVFTSESNDAPYDVVDGTPGVGEIDPHDLEIEYDGNAYANRVYVQGGTPDGSGYFEDAAAIAAAGITRTHVLKAPDCETSTMAQSLANMFLGRMAAARARGSFSTTSPNDGWRAGQNLTVDSADLGLTAEAFRIARVTTTFLDPTEGSEKRRYRVEFGSSRAGGGVGVNGDSLGHGQLVAGQLGGDSNTYVNTDGVQVTDGSAVRAQLGKLPGGDYGLRVVASDGTTVIVDGESDMFRISATGTLQLTLNTGSNGVNADAILWGVEAAETPASIHMLSTSSDDEANRHLGVIYNALGPSQYYASSTNGGPTNSVFQAINHIAEGHTRMNTGTTAPVVVVSGHNVSGTNTVVYDRYYVLEQTAI